MNSHVNRALRQCVDVFERLGISYVVMGGFAVRAYAIPRPTFDVDFTVDVAADRLGQLFDALDERGYTVPDAYRAGWLQRLAEMPLFKARLFLPGDQPHGIDIDVFVAESPYQKALFERRQRCPIDENAEAWFVSAESRLTQTRRRPSERHGGRRGHPIYPGQTR